MNPIPPKAKKSDHKITVHGHTRIDPYFWLNQRENKEVIRYLKDENKYTQTVFNEGTSELQKQLFKEIKGRIPKTDEDVPYFMRGYEYYSRYDEGKEYEVHCRKKDDREEIILDENELAGELPYFDLGDWEVSPDNQLVAFAVDTVSRRKYTLRFKNLATGSYFEDEIPDTSGDIAWANDNKTVFYAQKDDTLRASKVFKHVLGTPVSQDELIFHEEDAAFDLSVFKSKSDQYIFLSSESTLSTEYQILDADQPNSTFRLFQQRLNDVEYHINHQGNRFLIRTNYKAENFRVMETSLSETETEHWKELIPYDPKIFIEDLEVFANFFCVQEKHNGLTQIRIVNQGEKYIPFEEEDYYAFFDDNYDYHSTFLRFGYTSLKTPATIYDYDLKTDQRVQRKQQEVVGSYTQEDYETRRIYVTARDGVEVPVSMVYKKGYQPDGSHPLLLYAYGSYGINMESTFRSPRISLLDRGFVFAIAHIRGGQELGRHWYEDGKLLKKKNTFYDFIDVAESLIQNNYTSADRIFAMGGSAGGLLMGAVLNEAPHLFKGVIAAVPFVDVVTTMLDDSIPLTTFEYDEWGNPNDKEYYEYMLSYSPYDRVKKQDYPALLITTGLHDSQVQYWEPAKWVAKLRDLKTDDNLLMLWTQMDYGHGGASGRFEPYKETAMEYAFLLHLLEKDNP
ncbi:MAG: S9 family peptidase [Bacteroidales bacterium]|nr:S9 family peptidase [Bacteroidales bacterium]